MQLRYFGTAVLFALAACGGNDVPAEGAATADRAPGLPSAEGPWTDSSIQPPIGQEPGVQTDPDAPAPSGGGGVASSTGPAPDPAPPLTPGPAAPQDPPVGTAANDILERAEREYAQVRSLQADFVQDVYVPLLDSTQRSRGTIFHRTPDRFLMRFSDPQGDLIVADGEYVWMYYPSTDPRQVIRGRLASGGQQFDLHREFLSNASSRYDATRTGMEAVAGRQAHALTLIPRGPSPYTRVRLWVDAQDFLVRRFEIVEQNETSRRLDLSNLRPNLALGDDLFRFTPPAGVIVYDP